MSSTTTTSPDPDFQAPGVAAAVTLASIGLVAVTGWLAGGPPVGGAPAALALGALALGLQWLAWIPAALLRTERFYDLVGSASFLTLAASACWVAVQAEGLSGRGLLAAGLVAVWALRLGWYLANRVGRHGDGRFDEIKVSPTRFWVAWTLQGLWVFWTGLAAWILILHPGPAAWTGWDAGGLAVWALGFAVEVVADRQKAAFRADPANQGRWIDEGLWSLSRHPNYLGEILLWTGVALIGTGVFEGGQWVGWISPPFVALLLTRGSGVPLLEARAEERWGHLEEYQDYKRRVPVLLPRW